MLLTSTGNQDDPVKIALIKFENHPSVIEIKRNVNIEQNFSFSEISKEDVEFELRHLKSKKASTFMSIPTSQLKQMADIIAEPLIQVWNK